MKLIYAVVALVMSFGVGASAQTVVCVAGALNGDGTFKVVSQNPLQVVVLDKGAISPYSLKDPFSLFNTHYNINTPFDMSLVTSLGKSGTYKTAGNDITADWTSSDDGSTKVTQSIKINLGALTGNVDSSKFNSVTGAWTGSSMDKLVCTTAGIH